MNNSPAALHAQHFLSGGGEMGQLMRSKDWNSTKLGPVENWPQSLLTTLSIILNSKFPMFLFWGEDAICFYNDAYRPSLGMQGKHPAILGSRAEDYWQEIWPFIEPIIAQVLSGQEASWYEDQLLPIYRNGTLEDVYWTFSYSPVKDESGKVAGVFVTCAETTSKVNSLKQLERSKKNFKETIMQAPVAICIFKGPEHVVETANDKMLELWGKRSEQVIGKSVFSGVPEAAGQGFEQILENVFQTGEPFVANAVPVNLAREESTKQVFVNFIYTAFREENGEISGITAVANEVTDQVQARARIEESEVQFRNLISRSPIAMAIFKGPDMVIEVFNEAMLSNLWRRSAEEVQGKKLLEAFPELKEQKFPEILQQVYASGLPYKENEALAHVTSHDGTKAFYLDYEYSPLLDVQRMVAGIMVTVTDVTEKVTARQKIKDAADRLQLATEGTQLATWDLDLRTREIIHSPRLAEIFGHPGTVSLTHLQLRDQIHPDDRSAIVEKAFDMALKNGVYEYEARVVHPDKSIRWIRTQGKMIFDEDQQPTRMLGTIIDVTLQKQATENLQRIAAIVESSDDAIISKTLDGIITSWNEGAVRIFGYAAEEIIGQHISKLIPDDRLNEEPEIVSMLKRGERVEHFETQRMNKHGDRIDLSLTVSPIKDHKGNIIGASKIARDVTAQRMAERLIAENEDRLKIILDASGLGTWELNIVTGQIIYSDRYLDMLGYTGEAQPSYEELLKHLHPDDLAHRKKALDAAFAKGYLDYETRVIWNDGSVHWIEARGKVFYDERMTPIKIVGTSRDITNEKTYQQKIEESEKRFKTIADTVPVLIWMAGSDRQFNFFNKAWLEFTGRSTDSEFGNGWLEGVHPIDLERCNEIFLRNFEARKAFYLELRLKRQDGEFRWISFNGMPRWSAEGLFEGYIGACIDIHDRIIFEEKLRESETRFRSVADTAPVMIWMTDLDKNAIFLNKCWSDFTGIGLKEGLGKGWASIVHPDDRMPVAAVFEKAHERRDKYNAELRIKRKDGKYRWIQDHAVPRYDSDGRFLGYIGSSVDIQEQKFAKMELENRVEERTADLLDLNEQLIRTNQELEQFAYVSSHDLQEPLRKIQTFSEMLSSSLENDHKSKHYLDKINASALRMSTLIKDLLNYSRLSKNDEQFVTTDLNEVLENIKNDFELLVQQRKAVIRHSSLPVINAIPIQINQLFYNLVGNSLKFSEENPVITISSRKLLPEEKIKIPGLNANEEYLYILFEDNGIGFSQAHADQIFVIFQRLNDRQKYSGTGIGLAMCKKIVENHHGFISASGEQGRGAAFHIYLPFKQSL